MKTVLLFTLASCCDSLIPGLNGTDGLNFSSCCLIITVSIPILQDLYRELHAPFSGHDQAERKRRRDEI